MSALRARTLDDLPMLPQTRRVQFVVKTSKFCNLRCKYCYEFLELGDRRAISADQLQHMYRSIAAHYGADDRGTIVEFDWHGGEPLLLDPDFYWRTFDDQTRIFDDPKITVVNSVQTNLTVLNDRLLKLLREGFNSVGVSIDLFSGLRVNQAGRDLEATVLKHMDRLRQAGIVFSCITVLSRANRDRLGRILDFFEQAAISARILPIFRGADDAQNDAYLLSEEQVVAAYVEIFETWLAGPARLLVEPVASHVEGVIAALTDAGRRCYDKRAWEAIYMVNTDGQLYSYSDVYEIAKSHGNLFEQPMAELVAGPGHLRAIVEAEARMDAACTGCRHHQRACTGYPMAEEGPARLDSAANTPVCIRERGILDHIERRLLELGVVDAGTRRLAEASPLYPRFQPFLRAAA